MVDNQLPFLAYDLPARRDSLFCNRSCLCTHGDATNHFSSPPKRIHRHVLTAWVLCTLCLTLYNRFACTQDCHNVSSLPRAGSFHPSHHYDGSSHEQQLRPAILCSYQQCRTPIRETRAIPLYPFPTNVAADIPPTTPTPTTNVKISFVGKMVHRYSRHRR